MKIVFVYLNAFSETGGIQNFNKNFITALAEIANEHSLKISFLSLHDKENDFPSFKNKNLVFSGFSGNRLKFISSALIEAWNSRLVIFGHINLLFPLSRLIRLMPGKIKTCCIAHGIEVWGKIARSKRNALRLTDLVLAVSQFTKTRLIRDQDILESRIQIFPNTILKDFNKSVSESELRKKYGINPGDKVILTVARINSGERFKGYDKVLQVLPSLKLKFQKLKYILAGKSQSEEIERLKMISREIGVENELIITGYIPDDELSGLYNLCDVFILPSKKEGFGIVFLEALASGKPVIAGNKDGSAEPLLNGEFGILIDPDDLNQIRDSITNVLSGDVNPNIMNPEFLKKGYLKYFSFPTFKKRLEAHIIQS